MLSVRVAALFDGVVITWRRADEGERAAARLQQAQRLGQIGGWEENLLTGEVHWTAETFSLFGQDPGRPIPVARLHSRVAPDDVAAVEVFRAHRSPSLLPGSCWLTPRNGLRRSTGWRCASSRRSPRSPPSPLTRGPGRSGPVPPGRARPPGERRLV
ncbi:MAG: hypothetical protein ACLQID_13820 [Streptosporangiaceae bacterium]